jgi:two-component system response regulator AdeR
MEPEGVGKEVTVLVVEDDPGCREMNRDRIEGTYAVQTAGSGNEALDALEETIEVVLLDRRLPDMSGEEVLTAIQDTTECSVIMYSGADPEPDGPSSAADAYLVKPVTKEELLDTIRNLL